MAGPVVAIVACLALWPTLASEGTATAATADRCDLVAATGGSDLNPGTAERPLRTAQALVDSLSRDETGCLHAGSYAEDEIAIGTPGVQLRSYPGERATLAGRIWIQESAPGAALVALDLDGRNPTDLPSPTINADDAILRGNDITNYNTAICVSVGSRKWGRAERTLIERNRIHDCGSLPATNFEHGIYVNTADDTIIRDNEIYDNVDRGIQLYPDAQDSIIQRNVIVGNGQGVIFGGDADTASSGNLVAGNVIMDSRVRHNVESSWGGPVGSGNVVKGNCVGGGVEDDGDKGIEVPPVGFELANADNPLRWLIPCGLLVP